MNFSQLLTKSAAKCRIPELNIYKKGHTTHKNGYFFLYVLLFIIFPSSSLRTLLLLAALLVASFTQLWATRKKWMPSLRPLRSWRKYIIRYSYKFYQYGLREREKKEIKINFGSMRMSALVRSRTKARSARLAFDSEIFDSNSTHRNENINKTENEIISNKSNRRAGRDDDSLYVDCGVDLKSLFWSSSSVLFCWMARSRRADTLRCGWKAFLARAEKKSYIREFQMRQVKNLLLN